MTTGLPDTIILLGLRILDLRPVYFGVVRSSEECCLKSSIDFTLLSAEWFPKNIPPVHTLIYFDNLTTLHLHPDQRHSMSIYIIW